MKTWRKAIRKLVKQLFEMFHARWPRLYKRMTPAELHKHVQYVWEELKPILTFVPRGLVFHTNRIAADVKWVWSGRLMAYVVG